MYCTWNISQGSDIHINDKFSEAMRRQDRRMAKECIGVSQLIASLAE